MLETYDRCVQCVSFKQEVAKLRWLNCSSGRCSVPKRQWGVAVKECLEFERAGTAQRRARRLLERGKTVDVKRLQSRMTGVTTMPI